MIPLLSGITDTPKCPFFSQSDSFVVPGRDVSIRTNVSIAPWHHLGQIHEAEPYITSRQTHTNQHRSHLSHKSRKVSLACGFGPFSERQLTLWRRLVNIILHHIKTIILQVTQVFGIFLLSSKYLIFCDDKIMYVVLFDMYILGRLGHKKLIVSQTCLV